MHGVEGPDICYRHSLSDDASSDAEMYSLILVNPPFAGSLNYEWTAKDLLKVVLDDPRPLIDEVAGKAAFIRLTGRSRRYIVDVEPPMPCRDANYISGIAAATSVK